jgi:voltage-gated potassium channel
VLAIVVVVGISGYCVIEGWTPFEGLWMTVITLSTIGYGEVRPLSTNGRVFTIFLIIIGVGVVAYGISAMTAFFVEGELRDVLRRRRMHSKIEKMSGHYIVCGSGHSGQEILRELTATKRPVVIVERDPETHQKLADEGFLVVMGDATGDEALQLAGIERAKGLFAALGSDHENAFICLTARGMNPNLRIVSEQVDHGNKEKLQRSGADAVVRPSRIGGMRMASEMIRPAVVGFLDKMLRDTDDVFRIEEVIVPKGSPLAGQPIGRIKGGEGDAALVLAVKLAEDHSYEFNPRSDRVISAGETLVIMGTVSQHQELAKRMSA